MVMAQQRMPSILAEQIRNNVDSTESNGTTLTKWQLALLIGAPVLIGAGAYWYYSSGQAGSSSPKSPKKSTNNSKPNVRGNQPPVSEAMQAKNKGNTFFKEGKYAEAIEMYTEAIKLAPPDKVADLATYYQNRAAAYEMLKKYKEVILDCNEAIKHNNRYTKALLRRAKAYESIGDLAEALNDITAVCILEQFENQSNLLMTDRLLRQQSRVKAKEYVKKRTPTMPSSQFMRHYFMSYIRDPLIKDPKVNEQMLEDLEKSIEENHDDPDRAAKLSLLKGTIHILKGNIEEAERELDTVVALPVQDNAIKINALIKLGTIRVHDFESDQDKVGVKNALDCFQEAIDLDPNNPDIYIHRAQIYLLSEKVEEAKNHLEKCCSLDSFPSAVAQKLYVQFRYAIREGLEYSLEQALKGFEEALKEFPKSSEIYSLFAQSLMEKQEFDRSEENFNKAIECDPDDANLHVHRAILQLQWTNNTKRAVEFLEQALKVDGGKCQFAFEMLGSIEVQQGNLQKGIKCFDKALKCAQTELDCAHLFSLRDAAEAQLKAANMLGIELPK